VLPFSVELESDQTGWIKIGIVDLDSDYGRSNYIFSYTVQMTAGVRELVRGGTWRALVDSLHLQENHKYVLMFEGFHQLGDTGIDGATILIWNAFTLIWLALTSVQIAPEEEPLLLAFGGYGNSGEMRFLSQADASLVATSVHLELALDGGSAGIETLQPSGKVAANDASYFNSPGSWSGVFASDFSSSVEASGGSPFGSPNTTSIVRDNADNFYGLSSNKLYRFDKDGNQTGRWDLSGLPNGFSLPKCVGVSFDGTVAYLNSLSGIGAAEKSNIYAWDMVGGVSLGLFTSESPYTLLDCCILGLSNGDVLIGWGQGGGAADGYIKHYDSTGTLLHTRALPGTHPTPLTIRAALEDGFIWVTYYDGALSTYSTVGLLKMDLSDGSTALGPFAPEDGEFFFDGPFCVLSEPVP
jgi:hypothetical protein